MLKKNIVSLDCDGNQISRDYYFALNKAELMEMELSTSGGLEKMVQKIIDTRDGAKIVAFFKKIILKSYGEKADDGIGFLKFDEEGRPLSRKFEQTDAYSELFYELATDADKAGEFIKGIIPKENPAIPAPPLTAVK